MNKNEYENLKATGKIGIIKHYFTRLQNKEITKEQYDKAIAFWQVEMAKKSPRVDSLYSSKMDVAPKDSPKQKDSKDERDLVKEMCEKFGSLGLRDTGEDITI